MKAEKILMKFGSNESYHSFDVLGDRFSEIISMQDGMHIANRMKCGFYDTSDVLKLGKFSATLGHLYIVAKSFPKEEHNLIFSDLDPLDRLNYRYDLSKTK